LTGLELAVGSRRIGKRITLSRPRIESLPTGFAGRTELLRTVFCVAAVDDFLLPEEVRVTVDTDVVDSVVVATVSTGAVAAGVAAEEAAVVSAAACSVRAQPAANTTAEQIPASESVVIDPFNEQSEAR
jgi:hypothetical protein